MNNNCFEDIQDYNNSLVEYIMYKVFKLNNTLANYKLEDANNIMLSDYKKNIILDVEEINKIKLLEKILKFKISSTKTFSLPFNRLIKSFNLGEFEKTCLLLSLFFSTDPMFYKSFNNINVFLNKNVPTVSLAIAIYNLSNNIAFSENLLTSLNMKLFKYFFNLGKNENLSLSTPLLLNKRILKYLYNVNYYDDISYLSIYNTSSELIDTHYINIDIDLSNIINTITDKSILYIYGNYGCGKKHYIKHLSNITNKSIVYVDSKFIYNMTIDNLEQTLLNIYTISILKDSYVCFTNFEYFNNTPAIYSIFTQYFLHNNILFILSEKQVEYSNYTNAKHIKCTISSLSSLQKIEIIKNKLNNTPIDFSITQLSNQFDFTYGQISKAIDEAILLYDNCISKKLITNCFYNQIISELEKLASRIEPMFNFDDLILDKEQKSMMQNACNHIRYSNIVFENWNFNSRFSYGKGVNMLFAGPPGTGKTMAAQIIANELNMEIYKVDMSKIVSKYIGETEKNLNIVFEESKKSNVILFFDEMDSLFGKRSEVNDSNDKYSNMETSYILQKVEQYNGIIIMATNYLNNIDEAFMRRINYIIHFSFPSTYYRKQLWQSIFPKKAPLSEDIDYDYLSNNFEITGGVIKNIAVSSSFLAASQKENISMKHIVKAINMELIKQGKILIKEDFGQYSYLI